MADWFTRSFGAALTDIRQRVLEEPYFGKVVTPRAQSIAPGSTETKSPDQTLGWFERDFQADPARESHAGERDIHGNERGLER